MLSIGLPVVALDTVNFWKEKYKGVVVANKKNFWDVVRKQLEDVDELRPEIRDYYFKHIYMEKAAEYLSNLLKEVVKK